MRADDVRTHGVEGYGFGGQVFAVAAGEACDAADGVYVSLDQEDVGNAGFPTVWLLCRWARLQSCKRTFELVVNIVYLLAAVEHVGI